VAGPGLDRGGLSATPHGSRRGPEDAQALADDT